MIKRVFVLGHDYQCVCPEGKCYIEFKCKSLSLEISAKCYNHSFLELNYNCLIMINKPPAFVAKCINFQLQYFVINLIVSDEKCQIFKWLQNLIEYSCGLFDVILTVKRPMQCMIFHVPLHRPLTIIQLILQRTLLLKLYIALGMTCLEAISLFMKQYGSSKCHFSKKLCCCSSIKKF